MTENETTEPEPNTDAEVPQEEQELTGRALGKKRRWEQAQARQAEESTDTP